jgi:hypothetical protein
VSWRELGGVFFSMRRVILDKSPNDVIGPWSFLGLLRGWAGLAGGQVGMWVWFVSIDSLPRCMVFPTSRSGGTAETAHNSERHGGRAEMGIPQQSHLSVESR